MANEVLVGLKIGAAVSGTLSAAFGSARATVQQLGRATDGLTAKQGQIGSAMAASVAKGGAGVERLQRQYDQVGRSIEQLKIKQERLNTSISRGEALKAQRADLRGQAMETMGTAAAFGAPVVLAVREAISFQDDIRDIRITAGFDAAEEAELAKMVRGVAVDKGQTHSEVNVGVGKLVAGGVGSLDEIRQFAPVMAEVATATGAGMEDLGASTIALRDHMKITGEDYKEVMNMMAAGGKAGQFELQDMAKWLPNLASAYGGMGQTGKAAVAEMTAALQVVRMGAGNSDEAANNFKNFLGKLSSPDTIKSFEDAGIDLQDSMRSMAAEGLSPVKSMLNIVGTYLGDKGPEAAEKYAAALEIKDDAEREMAVQRLDEAYKLGELFRDQQVLAALRPMLANRNKMASIEAEATAAADQDVIGADFALRMDTAGSQMGAFRIGLVELGITVGDTLLPAINDILKAAIPLVQGFATWAGENPALIKGVIGLVGGLLAGKLAFIGLKYGINLVLSPFNALGTAAATVSAKWTLLRGAWQMGKFAPLVNGLGKGAQAMRATGRAASWLGRAAMNDVRAGYQAAGRGATWMAGVSGRALRSTGRTASWLGRAAMNDLRSGYQASARGAAWLGRGSLQLGQVLGGKLLAGLRLSGQAILWLGRALLMNPIGLAITGIALAGYLIYRNWSVIGPFFKGLWAEIKAGFSGGIAGITATLVNFSPLGLFYRAFAGVMNYFGFELPGKFTEFGGMLISGLVGGITSALGSARDAVVGLGSSVSGWFKSALGINSPSRVFMGYGANLSEGAALGITAQTGLVRKAAVGMAAATAVSLAPPNLDAAAMGAAAGSASGAITITYAPSITVTGGGDVQGQVSEALQQSYTEFERNMQRFMRDNARRSYGGKA